MHAENVKVDVARLQDTPLNNVLKTLGQRGLCF